MAGLPEQLVLGDGGQQSPEITAARQGETACLCAGKEASINRLHDVFRIGSARQPGREPAPRQRGQPLEITGEDRFRGPVVAVLKLLKQDERSPGDRSVVGRYHSALRVPCRRAGRLPPKGSS